jgi:predicted dehydrogenase
VMVATYHAAHYPVAKTCLEHGLHVFIEKPMVLLARHARELVELAEAKGRQIVMGYNHNHNAFAIRARDILQSGDFGAVQYVTGQFSQPIQHLLAGKPQFSNYAVHSPGDVYSDPQRSGGGHGHLQITHLAGMLFFTTGLRIKRVHALMSKHGLAVDLVNAITAEFQNGALGTLGGTGNVGGGGRGFKLTIYCENGWLDIDDAAGTLHIRREGSEPEVSVPPDQQRHPIFAPTHNFVDVINGQAANLCSGLVGWRAVELLDAAYASANRDGQAIYLDDLYTEQAL